MDYKCGTGHGVGFFMNVHEGPHRIGNAINKVPLQLGMIITNEPGVYKQNEYGIRIENTVVVTEAFKTLDGDFYKFETISYCPIDKRPIIKDMLTTEELEWLNDYHQVVFDKLKGELNKDETEYLKELTSPL